MIPQRNGPINEPWRVIEEVAHSSTGDKIVCGSTWMLEKSWRDVAWYLYVRQILRNSATGEVVLRGLPMFPNKRLEGMLQWGGYARYNVYIEVKVDRDDKRPWYTQAMVELPVNLFTRQVPTYFARTHYNPNVDTTAESIDFLTCRRVLMKIYNDASRRMSRKPKSGEVEVVLHTLSTAWIEELRSPKPASPPGPANGTHDSIRQAHGSKNYPYVSLCSGCGGDSSGARAAGANPTLAVDKHEPANITARLNFPGTAIRCDNISNIAAYGKHDCRILHMSLPCQPHSLAHTRAGQNDDANYLASLVVQEAIKAMNYPDILTMENVGGLVAKTESIPWFVTIINQIAETAPGYNLRWRLFDFREYGIAPRRTRFVLFASR